MRYAVNAAAAITGLYVAIFLVCVGIFAIEKLAYIVEILLRYRIDLGILAKLYASILPDAAEFLLPIAVTIASYTIILRRREAREFLVLSSAGAGHGYMLTAAFTVGLGAALLCLALTGFVKPFAGGTFQLNYALARANALTKGIPGGQFYREADSVMFVSGKSGESGNRLRVFEFEGSRLQRLTASNCADLRLVGDTVRADLCDARIYVLGQRGPRAGGEAASGKGDGDCRMCPGPDGALDIARVGIEESSLAFSMSKLLGPLGEKSDDSRGLLELLSMENGRFRSAADARLAGGAILLGFVCLVSVGAALIAVPLTARKTAPLALSGALALVIVVMVIVRSGVLFVGPVENPFYFAGLLAAAALASVASIVLPVVVGHRRLVTPMFVQG